MTKDLEALKKAEARAKEIDFVLQNAQLRLEQQRKELAAKDQEIAGLKKRLGESNE